MVTALSSEFPSQYVGQLSAAWRNGKISAVEQFFAEHPDSRDDTEEEREVTIALADNLIRSSVVPVPSSSIDTLQNDAGESASDLELVDTSTNPVGTLLEDKDATSVDSNSVDSDVDSNSVDSDDTRTDQDDDRKSAAAGESEEVTVSADTGEEAAVVAVAESAESSADRTNSAETTEAVTTTDASVQQATPNGRADEAIPSFRTANQSADDSPALANGQWAKVLPAVATAADDQDLFGARLEANAAASQGTPLHEYAASATALTSDSPRRLFDSIPQDLAGLERALQTLLHDQRQIGKNLVDWVKDPNVLRWILASSAAVVAFEAARRRVRRTSPGDPKLGDGLSPDDSHTVLLRLFPELFGLAPVPKQ